MMEVINEINYTTNSTLEVNAVSFEYQFDGLKSYIDSKFTLNKEGLSSDLYFKVLFLQNRQQDPDFSSAKEYYLGEYEVDKQINVSIDTDISVNNIYVYLKIYNKTSFFLQKYEKTFAQNLVAGSNIITNSFIDLRIQNSNAVIESLSTQKERLYQQSLEQQRDVYKQSYLSNLFYMLKPNKNVVLFFGVDQENYFKDNNFLPFLSNDSDFNNYLANNDFIRQTNSFLYNSQSKTILNIEQPGIDGLEKVFGTFYQGSFTLSGNEFKKENFGLDVEIRMIDGVTEYASDVLLPALEKENNFLTTIKTENNTIVGVARQNILKTLDSLQGLVSVTADQIDDKLLIYQNSQNITINDALKRFLIKINEQISDLIKEAVDYKKARSSKIVTLKRDYGQIINVKDSERATKIIDFNESEESINSINIPEYRQRADLEAQKYFNNDINSSVTTKSGEQAGDLNSLSLSYLSAISCYVRDEEVLINDKNVFYDFSYDDLLKYITAIDSIIANDINYDIKLSTTNGLEKVTMDEFLTEQRSEQLTTILNSLTVTQVPRLRTEKERRDVLDSLSNVIKTFEIPTALRTDVCVDNISVSDPRNSTTKIIDVSPETFLGNNLLSFTIFNQLEPFYKKRFYDFYRVYESEELDINTLPVQSLFLCKYYRDQLTNPNFLNKTELYRNFVVYGIIYFMFKSLFKISILIPEENKFMTLTEEVLSSLSAGEKYVCEIDYYTNERLGIKTPEMLQTSIYNRYFILEA